jgi:quercetin dioxygenase-like cupin family protein
MIWRTDLSVSKFAAALATLILVEACNDSQRPVAPGEQTSTVAPAYTFSSGTTSALLGRSALAEGFKVKRKAGNWDLDIQAKNPTDVIVSTLTVQPGGNVGWHTHPGPGFVQVTSGVARFYEADDSSCTPIEVSAGHVWLDRGEVVHIARNEGSVPFTLLVTLFVPPGAPPRIDEPAPGNCPF